MALPVPRRKLRPAPYATCCCGGAPVPVRRLPRRPMFKVDATVEAPLPDVLGTIKPVPRFGASAAVSAEEVGFARLEEERERKQLAIVWLAYAKQVAAHSECLRLLEDPQPEQLLPLFLDRAVSTLKRHLVGWRAWSNFCVTLGWSAGSPSLQQLLDFLQCLVDGSRSDRGPARRRSALGVLSAMTFAAHKLSLSCLLNLLEQPLVLAWKRGDCWKRTRSKEAVPLPFAVVKAFEAALPSACPEDRWFLSALLVMVWASLRWSDLQRLDLSSVTATQEALMGWCWRTKSSKTGMPFGFLRCGFLDLDWGRGVLCGLAEIHARHALQDFFLQQNNKPMRYTAALSQFRRCLVCFGGMPESAVAGFSLHSLKATLLSWAGDLGVDAHDREAQGHHRSKGVSGCVAKYSRNDIAPQLRCQRAVLRAVQCGWIPGTPLDRGVLSMQSGVGSGVDSATDESGESDEEGELREVCSELGSDSDRPVGCSDEEESDLDLDLDDMGHAAATYM